MFSTSHRWRGGIGGARSSNASGPSAGYIKGAFYFVAGCSHYTIRHNAKLTGALPQGCPIRGHGTRLLSLQETLLHEERTLKADVRFPVFLWPSRVSSAELVRPGVVSDTGWTRCGGRSSSGMNSRLAWLLPSHTGHGPLLPVWVPRSGEVMARLP